MINTIPKQKNSKKKRKKKGQAMRYRNLCAETVKSLNEKKGTFLVQHYTQNIRHQSISSGVGF